MQQQPQKLTANRESTDAPDLQDNYASNIVGGSVLGRFLGLNVIGQDEDEDEDPNEAAFRPPRGASIRARAVIANACGVRNKDRFTTAPSRSVKRELEDGPGTLSVESFFQELEEDLKHVIKVETKPTVVKKLEDEPSLTNETLSGLRVSSSPLSDAPPSPDSTSAPRQKRPRKLFDCVLLTSRKATPKRRRIDSPEDDASTVVDLTELDPAESSDEEGFKAKMKMWKNEKVKKNEDLCLLPMTLRARIRPIGFDVQDQHIAVDNFTREHMVTRQFMSETYGGSPQDTQPTIGELYRCDHDMQDFFYINTDFQPEAPEVPGAPGLWFSTGWGYDIGVRRVFTKIKDRTAKHDNKWLYVGQYNLCPANPPSLTVAEWRAQPAVFHNKWAQAIVTSGWGAGVCIRIHARKKYKREPTISEYKKIGRSGDFKKITEHEVKEAYFSGQEHMGVWTAKCVGYDNAFQQEISLRFTPDWVPMTKEERDAWKKRQKAKIRLKKEEAEQLKLESD